ncbi:MAG: hypothetical protein AUJ28_00120 [Parcubacteria group bacterium CG1_02_37_51]|uniref:DUF1648 domain-containing protein n=2 Tax=Candidatus Komeiliibacteriota TaxID=1817908 RepID=A0A2M8DS70_9BACT|nr:MAG: hypothetical protein AUJ28_00120 [Parcubacteria group bacterium CG1_02_37_51]PIY95355.1 MAG: hypothetical protein COY67_00430 [Candidatus Komeilibacteria bacterium CG_4_10_14_0_8_um_filter_37_78]PJC02233.1 MAG: hypothetical protein CO073_00535 [Candidatus Komeilibacteria bacterium CG_4_9_14_0_8_um_filter_36_9]
MNKFLKTKGAIITYFTIALLLNILCWLWLALLIKPSGNTVPLHYNIYFSIDLMGIDWQLYYQPLIGFIIILINLILAYSKRSVSGLVVYLGLISLSCQIIIGLAMFFLFINHF